MPPFGPPCFRTKLQQQLQEAVQYYLAYRTTGKLRQAAPDLSNGNGRKQEKQASKQAQLFLKRWRRGEHRGEQRWGGWVGRKALIMLFGGGGGGCRVWAAGFVVACLFRSHSQGARVAASTMGECLAVSHKVGRKHGARVVLEVVRK